MSTADISHAVSRLLSTAVTPAARSAVSDVIQLYLDNNFWLKRSERAFVRLVGDIKKNYCSPKFILQKAWIEGTEKYPHKTEYKLNIEEHYWSQGWASAFASSWLDKLPLPKRHAKKHNAAYKKACKSDYLMLDFYEL